jgi:hypothetical protein
MTTQELVVNGLLLVIIVLLVLNLLRTRPVTKVVRSEGGNPLVVLDRPYYYTNPVWAYTVWPYGYYGAWPYYGYGSGGYSGGIWTGGGGHRGGGGGGGHH